MTTDNYTTGGSAGRKSMHRVFERCTHVQSRISHVFAIEDQKHRACEYADGGSSKAHHRPWPTGQHTVVTRKKDDFADFVTPLTSAATGLYEWSVGPPLRVRLGYFYTAGTASSVS